MKNRIVLILILIVALVLRLGMSIFLGFNSKPDQAACGADTVEFEHMAWSAAHGNGFTLYEGGPLTAFRAPGYPLLLTVIYKLCGRHFWINRVVLSFIGMLTCWLVYLLVIRLRLNVSIALWGAFITAVLPLQFYWCGHFMSEPISAFLNVAVCLLLISAYEKKSLWLYFISGLVVGISALVRAACMLLPIMYGFLLAVNRRIHLKQIILYTILIVAGVIVAISPWVIRNRIVFGKTVLISTNGGSTFWGANNDLVATPSGGHWGDWISTTDVNPELKKKEVWSLPDEVAQDKKELAIGKQYVFSNLNKMPVLIVGKLWRLIKPFPDSPNKIYVIVTGLGWIFLFPFSVIGAIYVWRKKNIRELFIPLNAQLLVLLVTTVIFYGSERFRMPYEPLLAIYAAVAIDYLAKKLFFSTHEYSRIIKLRNTRNTNIFA